jgi:hypothetical protein
MSSGKIPRSQVTFELKRLEEEEEEEAAGLQQKEKQP